MTRHFMTIEQQSPSDLDAIYELATSPFDDETLKGQGVALLFERPSLRTRASSSSAVHELGGYATFFSDDEIGLDSRECAEDVGRTLAEMYAIAGLRVRNHAIFERMRAATNDRMSLINLLSGVAHPTQAVADVLTIADQFAKGDVHGLAGLEVAYLGDATNVTRSLAVALLRLGVNVTVARAAATTSWPPGDPRTRPASRDRAHCVSRRRRTTPSPGPTWSTPTPGSPWEWNARRTNVDGTSPRFGWTRICSSSPRSAPC